MSRQWMIDLERPLSDEDRAYLLSRSGSQHLVALSDNHVAQEGYQDPGPNLRDQIDKLDEKSLNAALKERKLSTAGKLQDRRDRLTEYVLENEADDDDDEDDDDNQ